MGNRKYRYITFQNDTAFTGHNELFVDPAHLNHLGAEKITAALLDRISTEHEEIDLKAVDQSNECPWVNAR